jgi:DNA-binding transcriptional MerR regulator
MPELYSVTELANDLGVTPRALRFYEDKGLIAPQRAGNTRVYTHRDRGRLMLILRGKRLGFTLREVREWLELYEVDPDQSAQITHLKDKVRKRIEALEQQRGDLDATLGELREILGQVERRLAG